MSEGNWGSLVKMRSVDLTGASPASATKPPEEDDDKLSLISWNVDGLDTDNLAERARGLCSIIVLYALTASAHQHPQPPDPKILLYFT